MGIGAFEAIKARMAHRACCISCVLQTAITILQFSLILASPSVTWRGSGTNSSSKPMQQPSLTPEPTLLDNHPSLKNEKPKADSTDKWSRTLPQLRKIQEFI